MSPRTTTVYLPRGDYLLWEKILKIYRRQRVTTREHLNKSGISTCIIRRFQRKYGLLELLDYETISRVRGIRVIEAGTNRCNLRSYGKLPEPLEFPEELRLPLFLCLTNIGASTTVNLLHRETGLDQETLMELTNAGFLNYSEKAYQWVVASPASRIAKAHKRGAMTSSEVAVWCGLLVDTTQPTPASSDETSHNEGSHA